MALARAWLRFTEDPIVGSEQLFSAYFRRIADAFELLKPPTAGQRSLESLKTRVKLLIKQSVRYAGSVASVRRSKPTGVSEQVFYEMETALYNRVQISRAMENNGRPFKFLEAISFSRTTRSLWQELLVVRESNGCAKRENVRRRGYRRCRWRY